MATSEARILANRENAKKSTGPRTEEGKEKSRANALKHGLCSTVLVPEDLTILQQRFEEWFWALKPQNANQSWLVDQVATISIRIDRSERMERRLRDRAMLRAEVAWDDDRMLEVEHLASRLARRPSEVSRQLRATAQGCDWLLARWANLARLAEANEVWNADQIQLAFDLLGTHHEVRELSKPGDLVDIYGKVIEPAGTPLSVALRQIDDLKARRERVAELDEVDRALVSADQFDDSNAELKRLRRYENTLHNRLRWFLSEIRQPTNHNSARPELKPEWIDRVEPDTSPQAKPEPPPYKPLHPPFDLEPHEFPEFGQEADIPKIIADRAQRKIRKADARRDVKRRKLEKMRA